MLSATLVRILAALNVSHVSLVAKFEELIAAEPNLEAVKEKLLAWYTLEVGEATKEESAGTWLPAFEDAWRQIQTGQPGENPHHGGIA